MCPVQTTATAAGTLYIIKVVEGNGGNFGGRSECVKWLQEESEEARATQTSGGSGRSDKSQNRSARNQSGARVSHLSLRQRSGGSKFLIGESCCGMVVNY